MCVCALVFVVHVPIQCPFHLDSAVVLQTGWVRYFCQFRKAVDQEAEIIGHIKLIPIVGRGQLPVSLHGYSGHGYMTLLLGLCKSLSILPVSVSASSWM